ncbi:hypothetical protein ACTXGQ_18135 [Marinobacter sp. 1Y8]
MALHCCVWHEVNYYLGLAIVTPKEMGDEPTDGNDNAYPKN